ncbi:hypothetical protein RHGRI_009689 [Rhododendron griersonianum]|uniref:Transcriptional adapter n=1 Tax=Rhododendron griersonianum TaxID=479676 RepID=A0AAV6KGE0_9ERIC|nr:hypothetical protein RHGRI_009689 [Rhododendron griersonianum]
MGRSRPVSHPGNDDPTQSRSKRKRAASNVENLEPATAGQGMNEGKETLYHCNYCNKDISGKIRIKCVTCPDYDLCVECFSVGAEVTPHKSNHPYRVMVSDPLRFYFSFCTDNLSFPLICPDWNADEEILLLEGIEMYGFGNWTEVAEHVGTKSKMQCIDHYNAIYMNSPCFPLPDMSHVMGKNREELLAMAKEHGEVRKGMPMLGELTVKEEPPLSATARVKVEDQRKEGSTGRPSSSLTSEVGIGTGVSNGTAKDAYDGVKMEDSHADRSIGEKKPRISGDEGPSMAELSGYNAKRQEFEVEYDNDAEQLLADMEFKEMDTEAERELKLRVLRIYSKRLDERKRRKDFILERNLLYPNPFEKNLSDEEREICQRYRVFMRFHSKEEHEELLKSVIEEHRILKRIQDLQSGQEARAAGCHTSAQAERYIGQKRKNEAEESTRRLRRVNHLKGEPDSSPQGNALESSVLDSIGKDSTTAGQDISNSLDCWDISAFPGADLLSETEKRLCGEIKILPSHYLNMLQTLSMEMLNGSITKKSDAHGLFKVDPIKVDRVYDMAVHKGIGQL